VGEREDCVSDSATPSSWAYQRFGDLGATLQQVIPAALHAAHQRALAAHQGLGLETKEAYGLIWRAQHEELIKKITTVAEVRILKPKGARYQLPMIGEHNVILYPWRFADDAYTLVNGAKMKLSEVRKNLLALTSDTPDDGQMTIDQAGMTDKELAAQDEEIQQVLQEMISAGRMVLVAYASNPHSGVLRVYWGDASQADEDGHLRWSHLEEIPLPTSSQGDEETSGSPVRPVGPPLTQTPASSGTRFDQAPLEEPILSPRPPLTSPDPGAQGPQPEAGSDD
jgi:hypothetical protein